MGFAAGLTELGLSHDAMARALIGFNVGVELGQLAFVAVVMPAVVWLALALASVVALDVGFLLQQHSASRAPAC